MRRSDTIRGIRIIFVDWDYSCAATMEFQIPQFIGREATIVGALTFRQFITLAVAGGFIVIIFFLLPNLFLFTIIAFAVAAVAVIFSFLQVGGQSFPIVFKNFTSYFLKPRVYVWHKKGMPLVINREGKPQ